MTKKQRAAANTQEAVTVDVDPRLERMARLWAEHRGRWIDRVSTQNQLDELAREVLGEPVFRFVKDNANKMSHGVWADLVSEQDKRSKR
ncbi:MAG: hypothetical protein ABW217_03845 [Polyangiaceae bacterium]